MRTLRFLSLLAGTTLALCGLFATPAHAGSSADSKVGVEKFGDDAIRGFAMHLNQALDARKANVAILARSGRPRSQLPSGVAYTHVAIAVFEPVRAADGRVAYTYTVYNLYQGDQGKEDRSYLAQDFTYDFVAGCAEEDVAVCIPVEALQKRLLAVIRSPAYAALHNPAYNIVANPWREQFDNCVTHTLKVCMAAIYRTDDETRIRENIRTYFKPTPIHLGPIRSLGSNFMRGFSHEDEEPTGLQTATYSSLKAFLEANHLLKDSFTLGLHSG